MIFCTADIAVDSMSQLKYLWIIYNKFHSPDNKATWIGEVWHMGVYYTKRVKTKIKEPFPGNHLYINYLWIAMEDP